MCPSKRSMLVEPVSSDARPQLIAVRMVYVRAVARRTVDIIYIVESTIGTHIGTNGSGMTVALDGRLAVFCRFSSIQFHFPLAPPTL